MNVSDRIDRNWRAGVTLGVFAMVAIYAAPLPVVAAPPEGRVPWTTGRVTGSPEAPPPFELERVYPKLAFHEPDDLTFAPGSNRLFVTERAGRVFSFPLADADASNGDLLLDVKEIHPEWKTIPSCRGVDIWGITFHPQFATNRFIYVAYAFDVRTRSQEPKGSFVSRFTVSAEDPPRVDPKSEKVIIEWQTGGHNGCCLKFGQDGYLYISTGDQSNPNPPDSFETGQDISDLRSSILRIDVNKADGGKAYAIPRDNPFVKTAGARGEVWCYGLRNPWRMSFDRATGRLWVADVGWELWESIFCAKAGMNCGWSVMEGPNPVHPQGKRGPTPITPPALALSHVESMSVTGGYVYRGKKFPQLVGHYIFGDWDTRRIWAAKVVSDEKLEPHKVIAQTDQRVVTFAEDPDGELYVLDNEGGGVFALVPNKTTASATPFPRTLTKTGIFADVAKQAPAAGVYAYAIKAAQWADGAVADHWIAVPGDGKVQWPTYEVFGRITQSFPKDSVLVRTFSIGAKAGGPRRKLETQLLHFDGRQWHGYGYRWREDQSDADLVGEQGDQVPVKVEDESVAGGVRNQTWHYSSRSQCLICHNIHAGYVVGYQEPQLDLKAGGTDQWAELRRLGLAPQPWEKKGGQSPPATFTLVDPHDAGAPLAERARSYLHANCAHCHREHGGGTALIDLRKERSARDIRAVGAPPILGAFGLDDARIITPGDPGRSVMLYRMSKTGSGRMPHVGSDVVDDRGAGLIGQWILEMQHDRTLAARGKADREAALAAIAAAVEPNAGAQAIEKLIATPTGALSVASALETADVAGPARKRVVAIAAASSAPTAHDLFARFSGKDMSPAPKLGMKFDRAKLLAMSGDAGRGREVFLNVAQCAACHAAGDVKGREFGPDLTQVAMKYPTKAALLEQIVEPSKVIAEGFVTYDVETGDGDVITGFLVKRTDAEVVLKDATLQPVSMPVAQVKGLKAHALSAMPEGLLDNLEPQQAADLLEFLAVKR